MLFLILAIICAIPLILFWIDRKWSEEDAKINLPGPKSYPLIGSMIELWSYISKKKLYMKLHEYAETYGDTFRVRLGPKLLICTRDLKIIESFASDPNFIKGHEYNGLKPLFGNGILISGGERWHKLRKLLTPAFHFQILERFIPIYEEQADIFIENLKDKMGEVVDVIPLLHSMALDIIGEAAMGLKLKSQSGLNQEYVDANEGMLNIFSTRMNNGFMAIDWIFHLTPLYQKQKQWLKIIDSVVNEMIEKRRNELINEMKNNANTDKNEDDWNKKRPALIEILLQSDLDGKPLTNEDIKNEVKTFMLAGHESVSNAMGFLFYHAAQFPNMQEKLVEEIKSLIDPNGKLTTKDLNSFVYLDCFIKESLRHHPPGSMVPKRCLQEKRFGDFVLPPDTTIMTMIYGLHMNEKNFKDCKKFKPDRWMEEVTVEERNPFAYQPFSSGLRNCIGQRFALLEIKTVMIKVLSKYKIELPTDDYTLDIIESGSMKSAHGVHLKFSVRK